MLHKSNSMLKGFFLLLLLGVSYSDVKAQITNNPTICTEYLLFVHPQTQDLQTVCVSWYFPNTGDRGSLNKDDVFSWAKLHGYCYVGRAFSYEAKENWYIYWKYGAGKGKAGCSSNFYIGFDGRFYDTPRIANNGGKGGKDWLRDIIATPVDLSHVKIALRKGSITLSDLPMDVSAVEIGKSKVLVTSPTNAIIIKEGSYSVENNEVTLGKAISASSPFLQCGDGGCCTSDPAFRVIIEDERLQLKANDGSCSPATLTRPDEVSEEDFHLVNTTGVELILGVMRDDDVLGGIVNPIGEELSVVEIVVSDVLLGKAEQSGEEFDLQSSAYPNPFNPSTNLSYTLPQSANVQISVYNLQGKEVAKLVNGVYQQAGQHQVAFDAGHLPSGTYLYRIVAGNFTATKRIQLVK